MSSQERDVSPITEDDIAHYLSANPEFFERHADTMTAIELHSQHGHRAVSLQQRQAEMLREKIKALEGRIMEMVRHGNENVLIADKLAKWTRTLLLTQQDMDLPSTVVREIETQFSVPQVAVKLWNVRAAYSTLEFALGASEDVKTFASSLQLPYCGVNADFEAASWLDEPAQARSLALIALRLDAAQDSFGLLVLASPDAQRFNAGMGTDFLERIGDLASAALARLV